MFAVSVLLLGLLFGTSRSSSMPLRPYSRVEKTVVATIPRPNNATAECGNPSELKRTIWHCLSDLYPLADHGYPWFYNGSPRNSRHNPHIPGRNTTLRDALDSLNHICYVHDRSRTCLEDSGKQDYCLTTTQFMPLQIDFQFICHHERRDENLVHSLQCLNKTRVMTMLYFHMAQRCQGGFDILDEIMRRYKNAYFYGLDIQPVLEQPMIPALYCLPRSVISTCIRHIVQDHCGNTTADLVQKYLVYYQDRFGQALQSVGLSSSICDQHIGSDIMSSSPPILPGQIKLSFSRLLESIAPGTGLDTVYGKHIMEYLNGLQGEQICTTRNIFVAYRACVMSSNDISEKSKFNILQFAHRLLPLAYHGTHCNRLEQFSVCWKLLQGSCGQKTLGLKQDTALFKVGCEIQREMDDAGCHWQDMLLGYYLKASQAAVWPVDNQCLLDPMHLEKGGQDYVPETVVADLDSTISLLQLGVEEISERCGTQPAKRLTGLLQHSIRYLQRDAFNYTMSFYASLTPT